MSERFVNAFAVSPAKLAAAIGTDAISFASVQKRVKKATFDELVAVDGRAHVEAGLAALVAGNAPPPRPYSRLPTLLFYAFGEQLTPSEMAANHLPAEPDFGLWNPAFAALGMPTLAEAWSKQTFGYPIPVGAAKLTVDWPITTTAEGPAIERWQRDLAQPWRERLAALPITALDPQGTDEGSYFTREELAAGLTVLEAWLASPLLGRDGNALVVVLDGDQ